MSNRAVESSQSAIYIVGESVGCFDIEGWKTQVNVELMDLQLEWEVLMILALVAL